MSKIQFGTGGFRAIIGADFTKENIQKVCQSISNIIIDKDLKKEICVGYDNRFMSENFAKWCAEVFAGNNIKVELMDSATSTPVVMYATKIKNNNYGVMITASHNPFIYNGIKIFVNEGRDASKDETNEIESGIDKITKVKTKDYDKAINNEITLVNYLDQYVSNIVNLLDIENLSSDIKIVCDTKHGSTVEELQMLFTKTNIQNYDIINKKRDAFFGFELPAPQEDNIGKLSDKVTQNKADIGFALDADGDRLAVVDENGNYIDNNDILAITYYFLVKYCNLSGDSVKNVATSNLLDKVTEKFGHNCIEVPVGFKYVSSALKEHNAVVGGESSGGLAINGHIWGKDSLLAIAICIKAMIVMKKSFSRILKEVKDFVGGYTKIIYDKQYSYSSEKKKYIDSVLFEKHITPTHRYDIDKIIITDYIKVYYKNGNWSLIRFSGTEPILRIFAEADTKDECITMLQDWEELLKINN